jgi:hypothetical protein
MTDPARRLDADVGEPYVMRSPCPKCGNTGGRIEERGSQDVVRCIACDAYCYCAPKAETGKPQRHVRSREAISPKQRARIIVVRANARCEICGKAHTALEPLHVSHMVSLDSGHEMGLTDDELNTDENLAAMCAECNQGLGAEPVPLRLMVRLVMARLRYLKGAKV